MRNSKFVLVYSMGITWEDLNKLSIVEFNFIIERFKEQKRKEKRYLKSLKSKTKG